MTFPEDVSPEFDAGWDAYFDGLKRDANPYTDDKQQDEWDNGWDAADSADDGE
jgi:ribosome modulation factor